MEHDASRHSLLRERIRHRPKAELHVHLRGAMPPATLARLMARTDAEAIAAKIPDKLRETLPAQANIKEFLQRYRARDLTGATNALFRYGNFREFLWTYLFTSYFFEDGSDLQELADGVANAMVEQGISYCEITISVREYMMRGIPVRDIWQVLENTRMLPGLKVRWIVDLVRDFGPDLAHELLDEIIAHGPSTIVGITLGGHETGFPPELFRTVYQKARAHGLHLTVHAGEGLGPESVRYAVEELGVRRIGHGVRAIEDPAVVQLLVDKQVPLEICSSSNLFVGLYPSIQEHPVRKLYEAGIPITINTDDPAFFNTDLCREFALLTEVGFAQEEIFELIANGFRYAADS